MGPDYKLQTKNTETQLFGKAGLGPNIRTRRSLHVVFSTKLLRTWKDPS
jgi:hypothetical protein